MFENAQKLEIKVRVKSTSQELCCIIDVANCNNKWNIIEPLLDGYTKEFGKIYWSIRVIE